MRTWACGKYHPCICAIVVREGNDVIQVDMCATRRNQIGAPELKILSQGPLEGTTINRDRSGRQFYVSIRINMECQFSKIFYAFSFGVF